MTYLEAVNRILRINSFIALDDDDLTSFSDTQHAATIQLSKISIENTLNELISDRIIPYEETDGNITTVDGTRTYSLPSDFVRFVTDRPFLLRLVGAAGTASDNAYVTEYPGGEDKLRWDDLSYRTTSGQPTHFYVVNGTTKKIGFYPVPSSESDGKVWRFPYQKDVTVTNESDSLPFHSTQESNAFTTMAARYMKLLFEKQPLELITQDPVYMSSKSALMELIKPIKSPSRYGYRYS